MDLAALGGFFTAHFAEPLWLLAVPLLGVVLLIVTRRARVAVYSQMVFSSAEFSRADRWMTTLFILVPAAVSWAGLSLAYLSLAEPRVVASRVISVPVRGRVAVIIDDRSGSMGFEEGALLVALKKANEAFLDEFCRKENGSELSVNRVGLVLFESDAEVRMMPTQDCELVRRRVWRITAGGGTDIEKGLWKGLVLLLESVDKGRVISLSSLQSIEASLYEKVLRLPNEKVQKEFCGSYHGLSLLLFTDGDFFIKSRADVLETGTNLGGGTHRGTSNRRINPFHVIDLAKVLCINTYFWSVQQLPPDFQAAFASPPGTGFAVLVSALGQERLRKTFQDAARKEAGEFVDETVVTFNPLKNWFIGSALGACFLGGALGFSKTFMRHFGRRRRR